MTTRQVLYLALVLLLVACQNETTEPPQAPGEKAPQAAAASQPPAASPALKEPVAAGQEKTGTETSVDSPPPRPPITEDFQGEPKISLFPRVGDFQPEPDSDRHPYWRTFIEHLIKVTGVAENKADGQRGWVFRSINTVDSLGYFAPLAVEPGKRYQVSFELAAELPEGASAGIGVLEFDEFLWVGEQYPETLYQEHYRGVHEGKRLSGKISGRHEFSFTTGPETQMIHLVLFRDGTHDRNSLMFDNIHIE